MILLIKSFIYRFSAIFGLRIFLARSEEEAFIKSLGKMSKLERSCSIGLWQAENGFTTIWTYKMPFHKALIAKIKHAFDFRRFNND
jgi:hypothetical protein